MFSIRTILFAFAAFSLLSIPARAGETDDFLHEMDASFAHYREAASYLRTGNIDLAALELEEMAKTWTSLVNRFGNRVPDGFEGNAVYGETLASIDSGIQNALKAIENGDREAAMAALFPLWGKASALRRASGFYLASDCILDAGEAMERLYAFKEPAPDLADPAVAASLIGAAAVYRAALSRCVPLVSPDRRQNDAFQRLFDGADKSLQRIPQAVNAGDSGLVYRLLIELRSFDRLIAFRYG